ncbi:MAG: chemotaxis protein CheW [Magnetovibrionaceae bacterium]
MNNALKSQAGALAEGDHESLAAQLIAFTLGDDIYGIDILSVREIRVWSETTELPNAPAYVMGVINLRGIIVPVFDLRARFGKGATEPSKRHVVIVVALEERMIGILVDAVSDIIEFQPSDLRPVPEMEFGRESTFLNGLVTVDGNMIALVNTERVFAQHDMPDQLAAMEAEA